MQYIAFHKPYAVLSSFTHEAQHADDAGKRTLSEFGLPKGVYAVGRLDYDSEGLLLLSDDGGFIHHVTDPASKQPKIYWAQVEGTPTEAALARLREGGLRIKDYVAAPCGARMIDDPQLPPRDKPVVIKKPGAWLELTLTEGKKRQVRHMTAAVGLPTLRLLRVAIGSISIAGLAPGQWRALAQIELEPIMSALRPRARHQPRNRDRQRQRKPGRLGFRGQPRADKNS
jgi:23S rRNA pseudouridine2457 synthase